MFGTLSNFPQTEHFNEYSLLPGQCWSSGVTDVSQTFYRQRTSTLFWGAGEKSFQGYCCECKLLVTRCFHVKRQYSKVSQTVLARIVASTPIVTLVLMFLYFRLCSTYPKLHIVPAMISDKEMEAVVKFRTSGRFPSVVWR